MLITIYKQYAKGDLKPVSNVELAGNKVIVTGNDRQIMHIVHVSLPFPTKKKVVIGNAVVKREPESLAENLLLTLKQNVTKPYIILEENKVILHPKYERSYEASVLTREAKDRRVAVPSVV